MKPRDAKANVGVLPARRLKLVTAHRSRPRRGERECGDRIVVRSEDGWTLLCVIDALGHGPEAAQVADVAARVAGQVELRQGSLRVIHAMHEALRGTRGAAAMACVVEQDGLVRGCGVGNVELRSSPRQVPSVLSSGILGAQVRSFKPFEGRLDPRTRLMMFSDGIATTRLAAERFDALSAQQACDRILDTCSHEHDDAAILVADVEEDP